jgi:hypothetical protein
MKPQNLAAIPIQPLLRLLVVDEPLTDPWNVGIVKYALLRREFVARTELRELAVDPVGFHFDGLG